MTNLIKPLLSKNWICWIWLEIEYKAALAIIGAIQGTSQEKLYDEVGLETFKSRRWLKRLCCMYKIINTGIPKYLTFLIPKREIGYDIRNRNKPFFKCRTESFKNSFFPYTVEALFSLDPTIMNSKSSEIFKSKLLAFIGPVQRSVYRVFNLQDLKFLTQLRLGLSHINEHRFRHNFNDCINPLCSCSLEVENTFYIFFCTANIFPLFAWVLWIK